MPESAPYELLESPGSVPVKAWIRGVPLEDAARAQIANIARMPFVFRWVAVMPDVHWGIGATVGSVIPTRGAIIPAAVGVDIGCGMMALRTTLRAEDLPDDLGPLRHSIERSVPHGRTHRGGPGDRGSFREPPATHAAAWADLEPGFLRIRALHPRATGGVRTVHHLGTLGTGNHFIEVCLDREDRVWFLLHSGSRGIGNRIGTYFIELAKKDMGVHLANLPDRDLAYLEEGTEHFAAYCDAVAWAQAFAMRNRELMMAAVVRSVAYTRGVPPFTVDAAAVHCHHNYVAREVHYGEEVLVTRKGAVRAGAGDLGIIPGSMGARSYIVRGRGNPESFFSCSHGAGRAMSRGEARRRFSLRDHEEATRGVECRKDAEVIDETPAAYKPIDAVMAAQGDLVEIAHELRQVVCVKG
jgi:tRNA-splicing ligase RtcB